MGTRESGKVLRNPEFSPIPDQGGTRTLARAAWGGYMAPVCTLPHARWGLCMGVVVTLHRTDTQSSRQQCRRRARAVRVWGGHLSKATRKLPGSNENMSFRLKTAGEQELKICNRNGGLSGGGWGGRRPGGSELRGLEG